LKNVSLRLHAESEQALAEVEKTGMYLPYKPKYDIPQLPDDVTDLIDEQLMELFGQFTAWSDFIAAQVACAQIDERAAQRVLDYAEAGAMVSGWAGKGADRVSVAKAQKLLDPDVKRIAEDLDAKHAYRKLVEVIATNLDRDTNLLSRELTRRTSDRAPRKARWAT
jgi:hypothetical protein